MVKKTMTSRLLVLRLLETLEQQVRYNQSPMKLEALDSPGFIIGLEFIC